MDYSRLIDELIELIDNSDDNEAVGLASALLCHLDPEFIG